MASHEARREPGRNIALLYRFLNTFIVVVAFSEQVRDAREAIFQIKGVGEIQKPLLCHVRREEKAEGFGCIMGDIKRDHAEGADIERREAFDGVQMRAVKIACIGGACGGIDPYTAIKKILAGSCMIHVCVSDQSAFDVA